MQVMHDDALRIADHPCAFAGYVAAEVRRCLAPPRGGAYPERALFMVGDSHCLSMIPALNRAVRGRMTLAPACVSGAPFGGGYEWMDEGTAILDALHANMRSGDVLAILNNNQQLDYDWLASYVVRGLLRPRRASLLLLGDYAHLHGYIYDSDVSAPAPLDAAATAELIANEERMVAYAERFPEVYAFRQMHLWLAGDGERGSNWVPGTRLNAYNDDNHLNVGGARYLSPYLCSALEGWGFFGGASHEPPFAADWSDVVRRNASDLLEGVRLQCHMLHHWAGWGLIRLHACDNITLGALQNHSLLAEARPEWATQNWGVAEG